MNKIYSTLFGVLIASSSLILISCSSDDSGGAAGVRYSGVNTPATITPDNAQKLSTGSTSTSAQAIGIYNEETKNPLGASITTNRGLNKRINEIVGTIAGQSQSLNLPMAFSVTSDQLNASNPNPNISFCGGSVSGPDNGSGTFTFNNLCVNDITFGQMFLNGSISITGSATSSTITYTNFAVTYNGETFTINATISCTIINSVYSCATLYVGDDGKIHKFENEYVYEPTTGVYNVVATYYHPAYGSVVISSPDLSFNCPDSRPSSGTITIEDNSTTTASITFDSCSTYTYCYDLGSGPVCNSGIW